MSHWEAACAWNVLAALVDASRLSAWLYVLCLGFAVLQTVMGGLSALQRWQERRSG